MKYVQLSSGGIQTGGEGRLVPFSSSSINKTRNDETKLEKQQLQVDSRSRCCWSDKRRDGDRMTGTSWTNADRNFGINLTFMAQYLNTHAVWWPTHGLSLSLSVVAIEVEEEEEEEEDKRLLMMLSNSAVVAAGLSQSGTCRLAIAVANIICVLHSLWLHRLLQRELSTVCLPTLFLLAQ